MNMSDEQRYFAARAISTVGLPRGIPGGQSGCFELKIFITRHILAGLALLYLPV